MMLAVGLTLVAAVPRLANLGSLSFYADEETTAFPARSMAEGGGAEMPTGMWYPRALPLTWILAGSARLFGIEEDVSYRIPVALIGALTVPLLFIVGSRLVGTSAALVASLMLALSEWHLVFSRQARMYAPFLFFFLAAVGASWLWAERTRVRYLIAAAVMSAGSCLMHVLTVLAAPVFVIPLVFRSTRRTVQIGLIGLAVAAAAAAYAYNKFVERPAFAQIGERLLPTSEAGSGSSVIAWGPLSQLPPWAFALAIFGVLLGLWAAWRSEPKETGRWDAPAISRALMAAAAGALASVGQIHGAALCLLLFVIPHPVERLRLLSTAGPPLAVTAVLAAGWAVAALVRHGVVPGIKILLGFPYPYLAVLGEQFPVVVLAFGAVCVWLALTPARPENTGVRTCAVATLAVTASFGILSRWAGTRFLLSAYPFLLLTVAAGLIGVGALLGRRLGRWGEGGAALAACVVVLSGIVGGHGLPQAVRVVELKHGQPVNRLVHMYPFRPDHEAPGWFVRMAREPGDVVIAEDPLQQRWYAGTVDYWFRSYADARQYLYRAPDTHLRDIYVNSAVFPSEAALDSVLNRSPGRVWLITSGETAANRSYYLDDWQADWLDSLASDRSPAFTGRDGVTQVYCVNCSDGVLR
jgi:4-amino-4-deoxy-L-arabinose transferase-like glycosyltransferase